MWVLATTSWILPVNGHLGGYLDKNTRPSQPALQEQVDKMGVVDSAIAQALSLESFLPEMEVLGGSGFSTTYKITCDVHGETKLYFVKTGGPESESMFAGESI